VGDIKDASGLFILARYKEKEKTKGKKEKKRKTGLLSY